MGRILSKSLSCLIVFELIMTGLGFCGHSHTHIGAQCDGWYHASDVHQEKDHNHQSDCHCGQSSRCKTDFHCPCLGGFICEHQPISLEIPCYSEYYKTIFPPHYTFIWVPLIFHPPQASV